MRLPYASSVPPSPSSAAAYTQISARRAPQPLQPLDLTLLHSPPVASGWSSFLGAIRTQTSLPASIRELCICRVATLNGAEYEWVHHIGILRSEGDVGEVGETEVRSGRRKAGGELSEKQWAVMAYTDAMTMDVRVEEEIFENLKTWFGQTEIVEITATVAAYNCVSRFLVALDVGQMDEKGEGNGERAGDERSSDSKRNRTI